VVHSSAFEEMIHQGSFLPVRAHLRIHNSHNAFHLEGVTFHTADRIKAVGLQKVGS
jgi:hypothetical protein